MEKNKKAEITTSHLISILLLLATLVILLFFYYYLNWRENINDEICHQSIVERSTFNLGPIEVGKTIPLKCETKKHYLYYDPDNIGFLEKDSKKIKLNDNFEDVSKDKIIELISQEIYNAHSIVGQGKLDFMPHSITNKNYCLIMSKFSFGSEVKKDLPEIKYSDIYGYMKTKKDANNINYYDFVYGNIDVSDLSSFTAQDSSGNQVAFDLILKSSPFSNQFSDYVIVVQMQPEATLGILSSSLAGGIGAGAVTLTVVRLITSTTPVGFALNVAGATALVLYSNNHPASRDCGNNQECKFNYVAPSILAFDSDTLEKLNCYDFSVAP